MKIEIENLTIEKAHKHLKNKDFSSRELTESYLSRIEKKNPELNAYIEVFDDSLAQAENADVRLKEGGAHILTGIPIAIKDNILINGRFVTAGSRILAGHRAVYDALVVEKLKDHGSVFLGRSNLDEFAMGSSTEFSVYGPTKNPHDTSRVAGGSSGGSASAVAATIALG
ncbi:MAG: Asp-tRNA(Asn)/Glu-tRNA(Gln) amidotransferase subunit GatA, partial [Thaumarchaeota archaeon]|nr:Asp-tRNA(Asn)/Glu-tRNA(Gln) amidotransferase subunit GatA [Nitrososphaerota archaeon]